MSKKWKITLYIVIPIVAVVLMVLSYVFYNQYHSNYNSGGGSSWDTPLPPNSSFDHSKNFSFGKNLNYYLGDEINLLPNDTNYVYDYVVENNSVLSLTDYGKVEAKTCGQTKVLITYENTQIYSTNISIKANIIFDENENLEIKNDTIYLKQNYQPLSFNFTNNAGEIVVSDKTPISADEGIIVLNKFGQSIIYATKNGQIYIDNDTYNIHLIFNLVCEF